MPDPDPAAILTSMQVRHYRIPDPSVPGEGMCESDRHHWPCDAYLALAAVEAALGHHRKMTLYKLSVYAHDTSDTPHVFCGHSYEETENSRHVMDDDNNIICLDQPEADVCESCRDESGEAEEWPCPEYLAISSALTEQEAGSDE